MSEPAAPWSDEYRRAVAELLNAIANDLKLSDAALEIIVEAQAGPPDVSADRYRKRLVLGLKMLELITPDQAAFAIAYRWPLKGA